MSVKITIKSSENATIAEVIKALTKTFNGRYDNPMTSEFIFAQVLKAICHAPDTDSVMIGDKLASTLAHEVCISKIDNQLSKLVDVVAKVPDGVDAVNIRDDISAPRTEGVLKRMANHKWCLVTAGELYDFWTNDVLYVAGHSIVLCKPATVITK